MLILDNLDPSKTALLIIDAHAPFVTPASASMSKMAENIKRFADFSRHAGITPHWVIKIHPYAAFDNSSLTSEFLKPHMQQVSPDFAQDSFHYKRGYSAFNYTNLAEKLQNKGIRQLLIAGCYTEDCVYHTILDASAKFEVALLWDLTDADYSKKSDLVKAKFLGEAGIMNVSTILHSDDVRAELSGCMYRNIKTLGWHDLKTDHMAFDL